MSKFKKRIIILGIVTGIAIVMLMLVISPVAKYLIQKYDVKYTGREIKIDWVYVNPFTGYVHFTDIIIYEKNSEKVFFKANSLSTNFTIYKLWIKKYEIRKLKINKPHIYVVQHGMQFNFSDLIKRFKNTDTIEIAGEPVYFKMLNLKINNGEIHYEDLQIPVKYYIKDVNIESKGYRYDLDSMPVRFSFSSGVASGKVKGDFVMNFDNKNYKLGLKIDSLNLSPINQYLRDFSNYGHMNGILDLDLKSTGNFRSVDSLSTTGMLSISNFHFHKNKYEEFAAFDKLLFSIKLLSPKNMVYDYDSIILKKPMLRYELYDSLDNIETMFGIDGEKIDAVKANPNKFNLILEVAEIVEQLARKFLSSRYKVDRFAIQDGDFEFIDYSIGEKFNIGLKPLNIYADSIDKSLDRVKVFLKSGINPYGDLNASLSINPKDSSYFDFNYSFRNIPLTMFNPYIVKYTTYPMDRGVMEFKGIWNVNAGIIKSKNNLLLIDPRLTNRIKNKDSRWLPLPLFLTFIREKGNVIDYNIPVTGNLSDPDFNFWDVFLDLIKNIFVKPVYIPYKIEVKKTERQIEKSLTFKWKMQQSILTSDQEKFVNKMLSFLKENPESKIHITPIHYVLKEKEFILLFEAKKKYFLATNKIEGKELSENDSVTVARMSIKDEAFVRYLNNHLKDSLLFTVHHKASEIISKTTVDSKFNRLIKARQNEFLKLFKEEGLENRVIFKKSIHKIPFNGFSCFSISYDGDLPSNIKDAFDKMEELDSKNPREKYKSKRENIPSVLNEK